MGNNPRFSLSAVFRPARSKARFAPALRNGKRPHTRAKAGEQTSSGLCGKKLALGELEPLASALLAILLALVLTRVAREKASLLQPRP
jgi:hypothetical protein